MRLISSLTAIGLISACAHTPPVETSYYAARSMLHVRVVRTLACNAANHPVVASTVTSTLTHTADPGQRRTLSFASIDSELANSDLRMDFYPDGRLKGINATTVGQGETILRSVIKLTEIALEEDVAQSEIVSDCLRFKESFGDEPLSLVFEARDDLSGGSNGQPIQPDIQSQFFYNSFHRLFGDTCLRFGSVSQPHPPVRLERDGNYVMLQARQPALAEIGVAVGPMGACEASTIWTAVVPVAQRGTDYSIPIPRAALFGKQSFVASFDEAGAITQLQYGRDAGGAGALAVLQAGAEAIQTSTAEEIANLKSEADLIAAQQRLIRCRANPASC